MSPLLPLTCRNVLSCPGEVKLVLANAISLVLRAQPAAAHRGYLRRDYVFDDFTNRRQAQRFSKQHDPRRDPFWFDADNDSKACELLSAASHR